MLLKKHSESWVGKGFPFPTERFPDMLSCSNWHEISLRFGEVSLRTRRLQRNSCFLSCCLEGTTSIVLGSLSHLFQFIATCDGTTSQPQPHHPNNLGKLWHEPTLHFHDYAIDDIWEYVRDCLKRIQEEIRWSDGWNGFRVSTNIMDDFHTETNKWKSCEDGNRTSSQSKRSQNNPLHRRFV